MIVPDLMREIILEKQYAEMTSAFAGEGGAKQGQPNACIYHNLFGESKRRVNDKECNDVGKGPNGHSEKKSGTAHFFEMPGGPQEFYSTNDSDRSQIS